MRMTGHVAAERTKIIFQLHAVGCPPSEIARMFELSRQAIVNILTDFHQKSDVRVQTKRAIFQRIDISPVDLSLNPTAMALRLGVGVPMMKEWLASRHPEYQPPQRGPGRQQRGLRQRRKPQKISTERTLQRAQHYLLEAEADLRNVQDRITYLKAVIAAQGAVPLETEPAKPLEDHLLSRCQRQCSE